MISPLAEPVSTISADDRSTVIRACRLETSGSVSRTSQAASRPSTLVPSASENSRPASGPDSTVRVAAAVPRSPPGPENRSLTAASDTIEPDRSPLTDNGRSADSTVLGPDGADAGVHPQAQP